MLVGLFALALIGLAIFVAVKNRPVAREAPPRRSEVDLDRILDTIISRSRVPGDVTRVRLPDGREVARLRSLGEEWQLRTKFRHRVLKTDHEMRDAIHDLVGRHKVSFHVANLPPMDLLL